MTAPLLSALSDLVANLRAKAAERVECSDDCPHRGFSAGAHHGRVCAYAYAASALSAILSAHEVSPDRAYVDAIARYYVAAPFDSREGFALLDALHYACARLGYRVSDILDAARAEAEATSGRGQKVRP